MAKITRQTQQIFAGQAPSDELAVFGSMKTGTPVYSNEISQLQSSDYQQGWQNAIITDKAPFLEEMNGVQYGFSKQLAYLFQQGMPEWDSGTTYYTNSRAMGSDGNIYKSLIDDNIGNNPITDSGTNWVKDSSSGAGMPVGTIFSHTCSASFIPENSLPCNGTEYTQSQFPTFYNDWLVGGRLNTCTYEEYQAEIAATGECLKIGLDTENQKFKVPTKLNQILATNNPIPVKGNGMNIGLTDGTNNYGLFSTWTSTTGFIVGTSNNIGVNVGTTGGISSGNSGKTLGLISDSTKSGIETDLTNTTFNNIRFFIVVATGSINQSQIDWSAWATSLQGKANVDATNFSALGKAEITGWGFPSNRYDDIALLANDTDYTPAPADGYYVIYKLAGGNNVGAIFYNTTTGFRCQWFQGYSGGAVIGYCPVKKGEVIQTNVTATGNLIYFRFYYAEGAK